VTLTADNFDDVVNGNEFVLVEFFAPWCGHCKKLAPEYAKAAATLKDDGVVLGAVDATVHKDLASKFGVRGYPTLKLFKSGTATEYKGGRTHDTIVSYIRKATGPPAVELADADAVSDFKDSAKVVVVGFFDKLEGAEYDAFIAAASADEDITYGVTTDATAASDAAVSAPAIVLFKEFDEGQNVFEGEFAKANIAEFVAANKLPSVIPFTMDAAAEIFQSKIGKVAFLFTDEDNEDFAAIAKENKGKFVFSTCDSTQNRLTSFLGIEKSDFPIFYIIETGAQMKKFPLLEGGADADLIRDHIEAFLNGQLKPHFKSEPVPENNDGPVTVVVGKNFEDVVMDETKDVLLEVYAPWCGHCKKLEPIYNELGEKFADKKNIVIAKMDGTANEVDGLAVRGFPTLRFYPAGSKTTSGKEYTGGRELADFEKYLADNAKSTEDEGHDEL